MKHIFLTLFLLLGVHLTTHGQEGEAAAIGTFQLLTTQPKMQEVFTTDILFTIEAERHESITRVIQIGQVTWVRVLSREALLAPDFVSLPDDILEVDSTIFENLQEE